MHEDEVPDTCGINRSYLRELIHVHTRHIQGIYEGPFLFERMYGIFERMYGIFERFLCMLI